jgi:chorismate-pyruvate lyase
VTEATPPAAELDELVALFFQNQSDLGIFTHCVSAECPAAYRAMLDHENHMTVTVEKRHACEVDVEVLHSCVSETHYMRKILLRRQSDGRVVQYGIVRLALSALQPMVRSEIMAQKIPLGRVLIIHNVLRQVQLNSLWKVACGPELASTFDVPNGHVTYGRTALIYCDGEPAVELLEIVAPEDSFANPAPVAS